MFSSEEYDISWQGSEWAYHAIENDIITSYKGRMNAKPKESDGKQFRDMIEFLRERYLTEQNQKLSQILTDSDRTATGQFWDTFC
jgi:hypothetical protein